LALALTVVVPAPTPAMGMETCVCPAAKGTLAATEATVLSPEERASVPDEVGAGESVAARIPEAPAVMAKGLGASAVGTGRIWVPVTVIVRYAPGLLARLTPKVLFRLSATLRVIVETFWPKSAGPATWTPFSLIVAEEMRFCPLASPLVMR